jgi:TPR repeat protein
MKVKNAAAIFSVLVTINLCFPYTQANADINGLNGASVAVQKKNYKEAHVQFEKMANHGCPYSQCALGIMSTKGVGTPKDLKQAVYWFQKSADQGFVDAERRLGMLYLGQNGMPRDPKMAIPWLKKAALHGVVSAQQELGKLGVTDWGQNAVANGKEKLSEGFNKAQQLAAAVPEISGGQEYPNSEFAQGASNIHQSWDGYANVAKSLDTAISY